MWSGFPIASTHWQRSGTEVFDESLFNAIPLEISSLIAMAVLSTPRCDPGARSRVLTWSEVQCKDRDHPDLEALYPLVAFELVMRGRPADAASYCRGDSLWETKLRGWLQLLRGEHEQALATFLCALKEIRRHSPRKGKAVFLDLTGVFYVFCLLASKDAARLAEAKKYVKVAKALRHTVATHDLYCSLDDVVGLLQGEPSPVVTVPITFGTDIVSILTLIALYWREPGIIKSHFRQVLQVAEQLESVGYDWIAAEAWELLGRTGRKGAKEYAAKAQAFFRASGTRTLVDLVQSEASWQTALRALAHVGSKATTTLGNTDQRLIWQFDDEVYEVAPVLQKKTKRGTWSKGRPVALKRLHKRGRGWEWLEEQDVAVCAAIIKNSHSHYYDDPDYSLDSAKALCALVGHPRVFLRGAAGLPVELIKAEPELVVTKKGNRLQIALTPSFDEDQGFVVVEKVSHTRYKVFAIRQEHQQIATILSHCGEIPVAAESAVLQAVAAISPFVSVQSDLASSTDALPEVAADPRLFVQLIPHGDGLKVTLLVRPLGTTGSYCRPGQGRRNVIGEVDGAKVQARRDLSAEMYLKQTVLDHCPTIMQIDPTADDWTLEDSEDCLEVLDGLSPDRRPGLLRVAQGTDPARTSSRIGRQF